MKWLIIGGGVHGTYLSHLLTDVGGQHRESVRVLDPHDPPLADWKRRANACGMTFLRSPATHQLDTHILSLRRFASREGFDPKADFIPPYDRPSLRLFNAHADHIVAGHRLDALRIRGAAESVERRGDGFAVTVGEKTLFAENLILCLGQGPECLNWPDWSTELKVRGGAVAHLFEPGFQKDALPKNAAMLVVGGGLTAAQFALSLLRSGHRGTVTLLSRHSVRHNNLDFDPCWIGPKCLREFLRLDYEERRAVVDRARNRGTVTWEVDEEVAEAIEGGKLQIITGVAIDVSLQENIMVVRTTAGDIAADKILLATGYGSKRPGGDLVQGMADAMGLPTAEDGYPILDDHFRWSTGIFVSGTLAELRGGPCARNISGVRNMGKKLIEFMGKL